MEVQKVKIALFQSKYTDSFIPMEWSERGNGGYKRLTEFKEIEFKPLPKDEITKGRIALIDEEIERITSESLKQLEELKARKQELLSFEHQS